MNDDRASSSHDEKVFAHSTFCLLGRPPPSLPFYLVTAAAAAAPESADTGMGCCGETGFRASPRGRGERKEGHHTHRGLNLLLSRLSDATCNGWQGRGRRIGKYCLRKLQPWVRVRVEFSLPPWGEETISFLRVTSFLSPSFFSFLFTGWPEYLQRQGMDVVGRGHML